VRRSGRILAATGFYLIHAGFRPIPSCALFGARQLLPLLGRKSKRKVRAAAPVTGMAQTAAGQTAANHHDLTRHGAKRAQAPHSSGRFAVAII
jgi:hypothetical protein